jgi:hypothetical protein
MQVWACPLRMQFFSKVLDFSSLDYTFLDILICACWQRFPCIVHFTLFLTQASILFSLDFIFLINILKIFTSVLSLPYGFPNSTKIPLPRCQILKSFSPLRSLWAFEEKRIQLPKGRKKVLEFWHATLFFVHSLKLKMQDYFKYLQFKSFLMV